MNFTEKNKEYLDVLREALKRGRLTDYRRLTRELNEIYAEEILAKKMKPYNIPNCGTCIRKAIKSLLEEYERWEKARNDEKQALAQPTPTQGITQDMKIEIVDIDDAEGNDVQIETVEETNSNVEDAEGNNDEQELTQPTPTEDVETETVEGTEDEPKIKAEGTTLNKEEMALYEKMAKMDKPHSGRPKGSKTKAKAKKK